MKAALRQLLMAAGALAIVAALAGAALVARVVEHGVSARDEPTLLETLAARRLRSWAVPARLRDATNPVEPTQVRQVLLGPASAAEPKD